ncbi:hypothetical protein I4J40_14535, partial [Corynebacterium belfantii]|nr:hypothetical protein [Corynebacterium belfantii]
RKSRGKKSGAPVHDDLLQRHFHADALNVAWVTDITEHWTKEGQAVSVCDQRPVLAKNRGLCDRWADEITPRGGGAR